MICHSLGHSIHCAHPNLYAFYLMTIDNQNQIQILSTKFVVANQTHVTRWEKGCVIIQNYLPWSIHKADAHFTPKNILLLSNTLYLKSWTHLAAQNTCQSCNLLLMTLCFLTPFTTQSPLLLITLCSLTPFVTQIPLHLNIFCYL